MLLIKTNLLLNCFILQKKKIQLLFKKFGYGLFKLIYGQIKEFEAVKDNSNSKVKISKINDSCNYQVYFVKQFKAIY